MANIVNNKIPQLYCFAAPKLNGWSDLHYDILEHVASYVLDYGDFYSFSAVCHGWRQIHVNKAWKPIHALPCLMPLNDNRDNGVTAFFSFSSMRICRLPLPEKYQGCFMVIPRDMRIRLLHPTTRASLSFPPDMIESIRWTFDGVIKLVVLECTDKSVVLIRRELSKGAGVAFIRIGQVSRELQFPFEVLLSDIMLFNDRVFGISTCGKLFLLDSDRADNPTVELFADPPADEGDRWSEVYIVKSQHHLMIVLWYDLPLPRFKVYRLDFNTPPADEGDRWSEVYIVKSQHHLMIVLWYDLPLPRFKVYRLDFNTQRWIKLSTLGEYGVLIDDFGSILVPASDFFRPSTVYKFLQDSGEVIAYSIEQDTYEIFGTTSELTGMCSAWMVPIP